MPFVSNLIDHLYAVVVILGKPQSPGQLRLVSTDVREHRPLTRPTTKPQKTLLNGVAIANRLAQQAGMQVCGNKGLVPGNTSDAQAVGGEHYYDHLSLCGHLHNG